MGCKESKHTVAAGNTIITPSPSKRHSNIVGCNNNNKDVQKNPENPTNAAKSHVQKQESLKGANGDSNARNSDEGTSWNVINIAKEGGDAKGMNESRVDEKVKEGEIVEVFDDKEIKKENVGESNKKKEGEGEVEENGKGNLVCEEESPNNNNFLPSRKDDDEETIEGIISEGVSGTSVYYTPHKEGASEDQSKKLESAAEEMKESVEETKDEEEIKVQAAGNVTEVSGVEKVEAAAGLDEGNLVKEPEVRSTLAQGRNSAEKIEAADVQVEVNPVKEVEVNVTAEINEEKVVNVAAFGGGNNIPVINKVKEAEAIDTFPVKQEAELIVESKSAAAAAANKEEDKISSANEENVTK